MSGATVSFHPLSRGGRFLVCACLLRGASLVGGTVPLVAPGSLRAQQPVYREGFDGSGLSGWEYGPGVRTTEGVLRVPPGGETRRPGDWRDFRLHVRVRRTATDPVVLVWRSAGDRASYLVLDGDRLVLQEEAGGRVAELASVQGISPAVGAWAELGVEVRGTHLVVSLDGRPVLSARGRQQPIGGGIGFAVPGGAAVEFDDLVIEPLGAIAEAGEESREQRPGEPRDEPSPPPVVHGVRPAFLAERWVYTGGPVGGLGYDVRMRPDDPDVMYVTDGFAGLFVSRDGGRTWAASNRGIDKRIGLSGDAIPVFAVTVDPNDPNRVWVGTQFTSGVYRSDDGGETWQARSQGILEQQLSVRGISVEPGNSDVVYLGGEISSWEWAGEPRSGLAMDLTRGAVYKSTDGGGTWHRIWIGDNLVRYVLVSPADPDRLFVSTGIFDREAANADPAAGRPGGVGILRSDDGGATWDTLAAANGLAPDELYFGSLFLHPRDPEVLLAASGNDPYGTGGVYRTEDGGDRWVRVLDQTNMSAVEICESDPDVAYAGSLSGFFRSGDGGRTWARIGGSHWGPPDVVAGFPIDIQCDPRDPMRVFVNNYGGGNFLSEDGGASWVNSSDGYTGALVHQVVVAPADPRRVYAAARSGLFRSRDGGGSWEGLGYGLGRHLEGQTIAVDPADPDHVLGVLLDGGPWPKISRDGGRSWHDPVIGIAPEAVASPPLAGAPVAPQPPAAAVRVAFAARNPSTVFAALAEPNCLNVEACAARPGPGVLVSRDGGESWSDTGLPAGNVLDLAVSRDGSVLFAVVFPGRVYRSGDGGRSWVPAGTPVPPSVPHGPDEVGLPGPALASIALDPFVEGKLYAGFRRASVMVSRDNGATWAPAPAGMPPEASVRHLLADPDRRGVVYAATEDAGVFVSTDGGGAWRELNRGLVNRSTRWLALSPGGGRLYVATEGAGVLRLGTGEEGNAGAGGEGP